MNALAKIHGSNDFLNTTLSGLYEQLMNEINEERLKLYIDDALPVFKFFYRQDSSRFSEEHIALLRNAGECQNALSEFIEVCEEITSIPIRVREEARELMDRLHELSGGFRDYAIRRRVEKEYRELQERYSSLPSKGIAVIEAERNKRITRLNIEAPSCGKCGEPMLLRTSRSGAAWWGCSTFPKCYGRSWLTKKQRRSLNA